MPPINNQVEAIKERADIVTYAEKYITLKKAGKNFVGLCPFHNEKTPSFNISPDLQIFKCFGCGKSGDVITFIQEIEKIDFREAIEKLANDLGIVLEDNRKEEPYKLLYELNNDAMQFFSETLKKNEQVLKYLHDRGITDEDIKRFHIGYAPKMGGLLQIVRGKYKLGEKSLIESGLFVQRDRGIRDKFLDRVMFPVTSSKGKVIAFTGRVLPGNDYGPKYLHTPETPIFYKSENVYGLYQAKPSIRKEDLAIFCEGTTDVIAAHRVGIDNIVAPLGTSLTLGQLETVSRFSKNLLFIFDSDFAGQKALERAFILSEKLNLNSFASNTSPYKDIDEMVKDKPKEFKKVIDRRVDTFTYLLSRKLEGLNITKLQDLNELKLFAESLLNAVTDQTKKSFYTQSYNRLTGLSVGVSDQRPEERLKQTVQYQDRRKEYLLDHYYLKTLLNMDNIKVPAHHKIELLKDPVVKEIIVTIQSEENVDLKRLHEKLLHVAKDLFERLILDAETANSDELESIYNRILKQRIEERIANLRARMASAESIRDRVKIEELFTEIQRLTNKLRELKK